MQEGAWPALPLGNTTTDPHDLQQLALMLELSGSRKSGNWGKENNAEVCDDARGILDVNLLGIYEHFLKRYTQHTCRPIERRARCCPGHV